MRIAALAIVALALVACSNKDKPAPAASPEPTTNGAALTTTGPVAADAHAALGKPAPDFTLKDLDGNPVKLSSFKGKVVVLEWFNPGCPFVNKAHDKGTLKDEPAAQRKNDVVWLAINSGGPGKQGNGLEANREGAKKLGVNYPVLLDEGGEVGHAYGATNTPHMFVIDKQGVLQYEGAVDNSPDGERESAPDNKVVAYVDEAIAAISAGKSPAVAHTKAYGCGVKYAK